MLTSSRRAKSQPLYLYEVTISLPPEENGRDARGRIDLLTTAYAKLVQGSREHRVLEADFELGCMVVEIRAPRFRNVGSGRVVVDVVRKDVAR